MSRNFIVTVSQVLCLFIQTVRDLCVIFGITTSASPYSNAYIINIMCFIDTHLYNCIYHCNSINTVF